MVSQDNHASRTWGKSFLQHRQGQPWSTLQELHTRSSAQVKNYYYVSASPHPFLVFVKLISLPACCAWADSFRVKSTRQTQNADALPEFFLADAKTPASLDGSSASLSTPNAICQLSLSSFKRCPRQLQHWLLWLYYCRKNAYFRIRWTCFL